MKTEEVIGRYNIPIEILQEYKRWNLWGEIGNHNKDLEYSEKDIEMLSIIMSLYSIGFDDGEIEKYMKLLSKGRPTKEERMEMLENKRNLTLEEIHFRQAQLDRLDYLRFQIRQE